MKSAITGMVLAGGKSRRMGQDKALMPWNKAIATKIENVLRSPYEQGQGFNPIAIGSAVAGCEAPQLKSGTATSILKPDDSNSNREFPVKRNADSTLLDWAVERLDKVCEKVLILSSDPKHRHPNASLISDATAEQGPLGGLVAGLRSSETEWNLVLACDMPYVPVEALEKLVSGALRSDPALEFDVIIFADSQRWQPLCGIYHRKALKKMESALENGRLSINGLLTELKLKTITPDPKLPNMLSNMNSPNDLPSVKVKVLLFASLKEQAGFGEREIEAKDLNSIRTWLQDLLPGIDKMPYVLAINQEVVRENPVLQNGDEIAIMPPFAGG
jgi:molybdopterin-guanine dinucleotide biosynthesis protein A